MNEDLINQLKTLVQRMEELPLSEKYAKEFEALAGESIQIIEKMEGSANVSFSRTKQASLDDLEYDYKKYVRTYRESSSKKEKLQVLKDSRADIAAYIHSVLACFG